MGPYADELAETMETQLNDHAREVQEIIDLVSLYQDNHYCLIKCNTELKWFVSRVDNGNVLKANFRTRKEAQDWLDAR